MPTKPQPYLTVRAVQPLIAAFQQQGHDPRPLLKRCEIASTTLDDADGLIPHAAMMQFWIEAEDATGDGAIGLHLAETVPVEALGLHAYALLSSATLREAYRKGSRYQRLIHDVTDLVFDEKEREVGVLHHALPGGRSVPRQPAEFLVALWVRLGRLIVDDEWTPALVSFAHGAPKDISEHLRIFHSSPLFARCRTALHVSGEILDRPNRNANPGLAVVLDEYATRLLTQRPADTAPTTLSERVRKLLLEELENGPPTAESVAQSLNMSVRTLHRKLTDEETTFRVLLDQLRHERAAKLLCNPRLSIAEVGYLLGFTELSAFYRAFKRWTDTTPADYRARMHRLDSADRPSSTV